MKRINSLEHVFSDGVNGVDNAAADGLDQPCSEPCAAADGRAEPAPPSPIEWAYIRVSSRDQNEARQLDAMRQLGISMEHIIVDKVSGKDFHRPGYAALLYKLHPGDTLVIKSIDRLGRNYSEILEQWRILTKEKRCAIVVQDMPLLDTHTSRDLTGTLIADIVLQLLSYVAEQERNFINQRQREGIAAAKARGVKLGRKPMERPGEYLELKNQWMAGKVTGRTAADRLGVSHATFYRWVSEG